MADEEGVELGVGSYGKVYRVIYGKLPCAAKLLHDTMLNSGDPGASTYAEKFEQECRFLSNIRHPNIVQYLGNVRLSRSRRPALLMELMDTSLTRYFEESTSFLPYHTQVNICSDIALALAYLHSNSIIHRDLSSNNILLIGDGIRAKVADFGMSRLIEANPHSKSLTVCPGAMVYMPPEGLHSQNYTEKLDCFSFGVLIIQIVTYEFPKPTDAMAQVQDRNGRTVTTLVSERRRRQNHIELIPTYHPLLPLMHQCIRDVDRERPSAEEICDTIATLKEEQSYLDSVEETKNLQIRLQQLKEREREFQEREREFWERVQQRERQLQKREMEFHEKARVFQEREGELQEREGELHDREGELQEREGELHYREMEFQERAREFQEREGELQEREMEFQEKAREFQEREGEFQEREMEFQERTREFQERLQERAREIQERERESQEREKAFQAYINSFWNN